MGLRQLASRLSRVGVGRGDTDPVRRGRRRARAALEALDGRVDPTDGALAAALGSRGGAARHRERGDRHRRRTRPPPRRSQQLAASRLEALRRLQSPRADEVAWREGGRPAPRADQRRRGARRPPVDHDPHRPRLGDPRRRGPLRPVRPPARSRSRRRARPVRMRRRARRGAETRSDESTRARLRRSSRSSRPSTSASRRCSTSPSTCPSRATRRGPTRPAEEVAASSPPRAVGRSCSARHAPR